MQQVRGPRAAQGGVRDTASGVAGQEPVARLGGQLPGGSPGQRARGDLAARHAAMGAPAATRAVLVGQRAQQLADGFCVVQREPAHQAAVHQGLDQGSGRRPWCRLRELPAHSLQVQERVADGRRVGNQPVRQPLDQHGCECRVARHQQPQQPGHVTGVKVLRMAAVGEIFEADFGGRAEDPSLVGRAAHLREGVQGVSRGADRQFRGTVRQGGHGLRRSSLVQRVEQAAHIPVQVRVRAEADLTGRVSCQQHARCLIQAQLGHDGEEPPGRPGIGQRDPSRRPRGGRRRGVRTCPAEQGQQAGGRFRVTVFSHGSVPERCPEAVHSPSQCRVAQPGHL